MMKKKFLIGIGILILLILPVSEIIAQSTATGGRRRTVTPQYTLTVQSNIKGAQILINGTVQKGSIPFSATFDQGNYTVTLKAAGYYDGTTTVNLNSNQTVTVNLNPIQYTLTVNSNVNGAQVFLNGAAQKGSTPFTATLNPGTYTVTLKAAGYQDGTATVNLNSNQTININLQPLKATIVPTTHHPDFVMIVDGKQQGSGPVKVDPGKHTIEFRIGALSASGSYNFEAGKSYKIQPTLGIDFNF
jgi:hypothetical protein